jgi:glutathione S-transferase
MSSRNPGENSSARDDLTGDPEITIVGRSTSHFTRITRILATELGLQYTYQVVSDIKVVDPANYAGNPALRVPILRTPKGDWYGSLNICRELWRRTGGKLRVVWPEHHEHSRLANAQEFVSQGMATEVSLLMARFLGEPDGAHAAKQRHSLVNMVEWLDQNVESALAQLPTDRELSYLELSLYCFVRHAAFRDVLPLEPYGNLLEFCRGYERRRSFIADTAYRVD